MAKSVPTMDSAKDAGKTGALDGGALAAGEILGRAVLGRGPGTAVGGIAAAATESGTTRDTMALVAIERAANEMFGGA